MGSQQQWQHSTCHQGSSTSNIGAAATWAFSSITLLGGGHLGKLGLLGNKCPC